MSEEFQADNNTGEDTSGSSPDQTKIGDDTSSSGTDSTKPDDSNIPFHEHPRWKERENEWNNRFSQLEGTFEQRVKDAVAEALKGNTNNSQNGGGATIPSIPDWFGGNQQQWESYYKDQMKLIDLAKQGALETIQGNQSAQQKAVDDANAWFEDSIKKIESENPGVQVDRNALLKFVMDNELIDSKGRWNYAAGWKFLNKDKTAVPNTQSTSHADKKNLAAATTGRESGDAKGEKKNFATSETFHDPSKRPW